MKKTLLLLQILALAPLAHAANTSPTFGEDLAFLKKHTDILVLEIPGSGARVAVAPAYQGRVMTSTDGGDSGGSLGWIHRKNIAKGIKPEAERTGDAKHIHIFGGEERFWLGPEGGQYALFFPPAPATYDFKNWKTPALLDTEQLGLELFDDLDALADGGLGGLLGLADFRLQVDGLGVFLEDLLSVEQAHVGGGREDGSGGEEEREEGLHEVRI